MTTKTGTYPPARPATRRPLTRRWLALAMLCVSLLIVADGLWQISGATPGRIDGPASKG